MLFCQTTHIEAGRKIKNKTKYIFLRTYHVRYQGQEGKMEDKGYWTSWDRGIREKGSEDVVSAVCDQRDRWIVYIV